MVSYATVAQLQARANLEADLTADKVQVIEEILEATSRRIENFCNVSPGYFRTEGLVEPDIREACIALTLVMLKRYEGAMASTLAGPELGNLRVDFGAVAFSRDVRELLVNGRHVHPLYAH